MSTILLAGIIVACDSGSRFADPQPPVIIISVDTLRSDRLPAYGYTAVATPHLDALRRDSILYERAWSHCPLTLPSHASMLTGLLPADHGVRDNLGFRIDEKVPMIQELLAAKGYATGGAVSAFVLRKETGMARGFDFYDDEVEPLGVSQVIARVQRDGAETVSVAKSWIARHESGPFFFFLHLYDPHSPYTPPEPYLSRYADHYDGEVAWTDHVVGTFIDDLKARGVYDRALILFLSDHGEGLFDHGEEEHGIFLYREAIQVPLFVKLPHSQRAGESVKRSVQLVDVFPTIADVARLDPPEMPLTGVTLLAPDDDVPERKVYSESYYPRLHFGWSDVHSLIEGDYHYIRSPIPELYDFSADPLEKLNILEEQRRVTFAMRRDIEPFIRDAEAPSTIDPEEAAKLAALGYLGANPTSADEGELPDPKTTIDVFHQIRVAFTHYRDERLVEALALIDTLLADNRRIVDLWDLKSKVLSKLGRNEEAIEAAKEGLRQSPKATGLITAVANLSILVGALDDAEKHADLLMKTDPGQAHELLARAAAIRKDYEKAEAEARLAMETGREATSALMTLAMIAKDRGDLEGALKYMDEALATVASKRNRRVPNLHLYRGDILARLGRTTEAEREFRQEITLYPREPEAYASLILLLSSEGRTDEATQFVFALVERAPRPPSYVAIAETLQAVGDTRGAVYWTRQGLRKYPDDPGLRKLAKSL